MKYKNILKTDVSPLTLTSSVIALLNKYASYISDTITVNVTLNDRAISRLTKEVSESVMFTDFYKEIKHDLPEHFVSPFLIGDILTLEWITERNSGNTEHQITFIKIEHATYSLEITTVENDFFYLVFKNTHHHLQTFINSIAVNSENLLAQINYISENENEIIKLHSHGPIDKEVQTPELLHHLFEQTARKYFNHPAILSPEGNLNYYELNTRANSMAIKLNSYNLNQGDYVGLLLKRSPELYISILAILKTGAAYVPLDTSYPADRITYILNDCHAKLLISNQNSYPRSLVLSCPVLSFDKQLFNSLDSELRILLPEINQSTQSPAYIIYTSGSTGRPKGVIISHASASNLIKAEHKIFHLKPTDKVAQGFSVAFDASVEEIWLAFRSGAALVPVKEETMKSADELSGFISKNGITVLSTVPTLLSMMQGHLDSLRLLILGGECCPTELLERWHHPRLRIVNTYGPTETTVIATYSDFTPNQRITIGKPVMNYSTHILDQNLLSVPIGVAGELCIAGAGLASGYLNNRELTNEKFISAKIKHSDKNEIKVYRTGDLVRLNHEGEIEFLGRIDSQVKIRGYRIELSEIECQLLQISEVRNAVVVVKEDSFKVQRIIAYIILKNDTDQFDESKFRTILRRRLADYMIPSSFMVLKELPLLPSGKVDKKKLPEPILLVSKRAITEPRNDTEKKIQQIWQIYFPTQQVSVTDDFFDLGGDSLLAALTMSEMRKEHDFRSISVQDIYKFRSVEKLAEFIINNKTKENPGSEVQSTKSNRKIGEETLKTSKLTSVLTSILQLFSFYFFYLVASVVLIVPYAIITRTSINPYNLIGILILCLFIWMAFFIVLSIVVKWCCIGKYREGRYPLWGWYYFRFWLVGKIIGLTPLSIFCGTPFVNIYFRLMGARIGKGVYMGTDQVRIFDLLEIGDNSSISRQANLLGYSVRNGELIIGKITIGENGFVGACSVLSENSELKNNSSLNELSLLSSGEVIPQNEIWQGSPAVKTDINITNKKTKEVKHKSISYPAYLFLQTIAIIFLLLYPLSLSIPFTYLFILVFWNLGLGPAILTLIPSAALYIIIFHALITLFKWIIIGKSKEEEFSIYSFRYIQKWTIDILIGQSLIFFRSLYATIYLSSWLRSLGVKIGKASEISTVNQLNTDLLEIGGGSFLADSITIGTPEVRNKIMSIKKISIGEKTFLGNSAVISCGKKIGNNVLIGVLSTPPQDDPERYKDASSWLGSPPMFLPKRQLSEKFPDRLTYNPTRVLYLKRGLIEFIKITLPFLISSVIIALYFVVIHRSSANINLRQLFWLSPIILFTLFLSSAIFTVFVKRILMGRYKRSNKPLWSLFVWKNELVNSLCECLVYPSLINMTLGTPFASLFFKKMGVKIGKNVYFDTTEITEFDLVSIGDNVCLNHRCTIQTHLFEDRVMKMADLKIGSNCNVGSMSVVLYDSVMESNSSIDALSLVMKGEVIQTGTRWAGSPAKFIA